MLIDLQNSFTERLSSNVSAKQYLNIPPRLKRVASLPCEMFVLENRNDPEPSEANFQAGLSRRKQLLRDIHPVNDVSIILLTRKNVFTSAAPKHVHAE